MKRSATHTATHAHYQTLPLDTQHTAPHLHTTARYTVNMFAGTVILCEDSATLHTAHDWKQQRHTPDSTLVTALETAEAMHAQNAR
jgi:hypothetical protein